MQILDDDEQRHHRSARSKPTLDRIEEQLTLPFVGIEADGGRLDNPDRIGETRREARQHRSVVGETAGDLRRFEVGRVGGDDLRERAVRLIDVLVARAKQHPTTVRGDVASELGDEAALSDPSLPRQRDEQGRSRPRHLPVVAQELAFRAASDERRRIGEQLEHRRKRRHLSARNARAQHTIRPVLHPNQLVAVTSTELPQERRHV